MKNRIWKTTGVVLVTVCSLLIGSGNRIQGAEAGNYGYEATAVQDEEQGTGNSSEDFEIKDEEISGSDEAELPETSVFLETAEEEELQETEENTGKYLSPSLPSIMSAFSISEQASNSSSFFG